MIQIEADVYNNYPIYIFACDSNINDDDIVKYSLYMETMILPSEGKFYTAYFVSTADETTSLSMIKKYKDYIKKISKNLKDRCIASFIQSEDPTIRRMVRIMEGLTKSHHPSKLVKTTNEGYTFLSKHGNQVQISA
jgi:hypothetical protein